VEFFQTLIPAGALSFDVGANIGEKSEALLASGAQVVAFEPNPLVLPELLARCGSRTQWRLIQAALGSSAAIATLHARESHGASSLDKSWDGGKVLSMYNVPVVTLDAAILHFGLPFFCKVDVEGWELEVLMGLTRSIPLISIEFHLNERDISKTLACLRSMERFGSSRVNLTPAESAELHLEKWMTLEEFLAWFPGDLSSTLPGCHYGDIFVLNEEAREQNVAISVASLR